MTSKLRKYSLLNTRDPCVYVYMYVHAFVCMHVCAEGKEAEAENTEERRSLMKEDSRRSGRGRDF